MPGVRRKRKLMRCFLHRRVGCKARICLGRRSPLALLRPLPLRRLAVSLVLLVGKQVIAWAVRAFLLVVWLVLLALPVSVWLAVIWLLGSEVVVDPADVEDSAGCM